MAENSQSSFSPESVKQCTKCRVEWPRDVAHFHRSARARDGLKWECKACEAARYQADRESRIAKSAARYAILRESGNREAYRQKARERYAANREARRAYFAKYREANRDKMRAYFKDFRAKTIDEYRLRQIVTEGKRRAIKRGGLGLTIPPTIIAALQVAQKDRCWCCQSKLLGKFDVDHRIPLSRGGSHTEDNLVLACASCNRSKGAKMPWEMSGGRLL